MLTATRATLVVACFVVAGVGGCDDDFVRGDGGDFAATIEITNNVGLLGSIALELRFVGPSGEFVSDDDGVSCDVIAGDAFAVVTPRSSDRVDVGVSSFTGIATPGPLLRCQVRSVTPVTASDLTIEVTEALDTAGDPPAELPTLAVTDVSDVATASTIAREAAGSTTTLEDR